MSYARVEHDTITNERGNLPGSERRLDTREWVMGLDSAPGDLVTATGWYEIIDTPRPDDTETTTYDRTVELVDGIPTVVWTPRLLTEPELVALQEAENKSAIETNLAEDLDAMQVIIDTTNATINSNPAAHIKNIARMNRRLGRLAIDDLDGTE